MKLVSEAAAAEASQGVAFLRWRGGVGAVALLDVRDRLQLLEHAGRRTALDVLRASGDKAATFVVGEVLVALHSGSPLPPPPELQPMARRFASLFDRAAADRTAGVHSLFVEAADLASQLIAAQDDVRPLHGDIHHENIIQSSRGWLAIDPHGLIGDPAYDAANMLYNPVAKQALRTDPFRQAHMAEQLAEAVKRPAETILAYAFCHACLSAAWHAEDGNLAESALSLEVAEVLWPLATG